MGKKKEKLKDGIYLYGKASEEVTGSMYMVRFNGKKILLECGLYQSSSNSYLDAYRVNSKKFNFRPKDIDYVFICHAHIDHCGLLPRLVKEGFRGKIIMTSDTKAIVDSLLKNSSFIVQSEANILSKKFARIYKPLYTFNDYKMTMTLIETFDEYHKVHKLDDKVSFEWFEDGHCVGAAQLFLYLKSDLKTRTIHYTSDLGALHPVNHYVSETEIPGRHSDVCLMESTYGNPKRQTNKTRAFDMEKISAAVTTANHRKGTIICPAFSFSRTQELLTCFYLLYGNDPEFKTLIYVDSMLSVEITKKYENILTGDDLALWKKVRTWKNLRLITDKEISKTIVANQMPKIVITSSGFCTNGRVIDYLRNHIKDSRNTIIFSGYVGDNPSYLSYRLAAGKKDPLIKINGDVYPNRANVLTLGTYSSHMNHNELVNFGSHLNTNKLVLVHGAGESKDALAPVIQEQVFKNNRTYQVIKGSMGLIIGL